MNITVLVQDSFGGLVLGGAALLGHSFVAGLRSHLKNEFGKFRPHDFDMQVARELLVEHNIGLIFLLGSRGEKICDANIPWGFLGVAKPKIFLLDYESNGIVPGVATPVIVDALCNLARGLSESFAAVVVIMSVVPRCGHLHGMQENVFMEKATDLGRKIKDRIQNTVGIVYHKHKGFYDIEEDGKKSPQDVGVWSHDGVHPNKPRGRAMYKNSLRAALSKDRSENEFWGSLSVDSPNRNCNKNKNKKEFKNFGQRCNC